MELRERVKDQLYRIDETFERVDFTYRDLESGAIARVQTLEEVEWPDTYHALDLVPWEPEEAAEGVAAEPGVTVAEAGAPAGPGADTVAATAAPALQEGLVRYRENQRGVSYDLLFGPYVAGAERIEIIDPYVRTFHQCRNVMELMGVLIKRLDYTKASPSVHLVTAPDMYADSKREDYLRQIRDAVEPMDIDFTWEIDDSGIHARHLKVDDEWDILLDRGLDIWQKFDSGNAFALESSIPEMRRVRQFEVTYLRVG
jgi:ATP-dependent Lon protease